MGIAVAPSSSSCLLPDVEPWAGLPVLLLVAPGGFTSRVGMSVGHHRQDREGGQLAAQEGASPKLRAVLLRLAWSLQIVYELTVSLTAV